MLPRSSRTGRPSRTSRFSNGMCAMCAASRRESVSSVGAVSPAHRMRSKYASRSGNVVMSRLPAWVAVQVFRRPLETAGTQRQHEGVAMSEAFERLDRRALVDDARVVEKQAAPWLLHREAQAGRPVGIADAWLAALDARSIDEHDGDQVDAVAMRSLGRRPADAVGSVDAELVRLDVPQ